MKSNINNALIASYPEAINNESIQITKNNLSMAYKNEHKTCSNFVEENNASDLKPEIFNYHTLNERNELTMERTDVVTLNQHADLTTYYKEGKNWSSLKVYESSPEGIYEVDLFMNPNEFYAEGNTSVSVRFYSNEYLKEKNIDVEKLHPIDIYGKNIPAQLLLETNMGYLTREQMEQLTAQACHMGMKAFYAQLYAQEQAKKEETAMTM